MTDERPFPQPGAQPPGEPTLANPTPPGVGPAGPAATATGKKNTIGTVGLILGLSGFALACIPLLGVIGWPLLLAALVLGIIGLTKAGLPKGTSIAAVVVAILGPVIAFYIAANLLAGAADDGLKNTVSTPTTQSNTTTEPATGTDDAEEPAAGDVGTSRDNPAPIGSTITTSDWEVTIDKVDIDAAKIVDEKRQAGTTEPDEGNIWLLVTLSVTYLGDDADGAMPWTTVDYVTPDGNTIDQDATGYFLEGSYDGTSTLYNGATSSGTLLFQVPADTADQGVLAVSPDLLADNTFVAVK